MEVDESNLGMLFTVPPIVVTGDSVVPAIAAFPGTFDAARDETEEVDDDVPPSA
jgi:hypothetical protein